MGRQYVGSNSGYQREPAQQYNRRDDGDRRRLARERPEPQQRESGAASAEAGIPATCSPTPRKKRTRIQPRPPAFEHGNRAGYSAGKADQQREPRIEQRQKYGDVKPRRLHVLEGRGPEAPELLLQKENPQKLAPVSNRAENVPGQRANGEREQRSRPEPIAQAPPSHRRAPEQRAPAAPGPWPSSPARGSAAAAVRLADWLPLSPSHTHGKRQQYAPRRRKRPAADPSPRHGCRSTSPRWWPAWPSRKKPRAGPIPLSDATRRTPETGRSGEPPAGAARGRGPARSGWPAAVIQYSNAGFSNHAGPKDEA